MNREQAITELAGIISKYHIGCNLRIACNTKCDECAAKAVLDAGYRLIPELKVLSAEEIGNALQPVCDDEAITFYCSDTTAISCINCHVVAQAQRDYCQKQLEV